MLLDTLIKLFLELEGADPDTLRPDLPHPLGTSGRACPQLEQRHSSAAVAPLRGSLVHSERCLLLCGDSLASLDLHAAFQWINYDN